MQYALVPDDPRSPELEVHVLLTKPYPEVRATLDRAFPGNDLFYRLVRLEDGPDEARFEVWSKAKSGASFLGGVRMNQESEVRTHVVIENRTGAEVPGRPTLKQGVPNIVGRVMGEFVAVGYLTEEEATRLLKALDAYVNP